MARTASIEPTVTVSGGIRLVHIHDRHSAAGIFGIAVKAGSRNDPEGKDGLAHFVEHTLFKGTERRSSWHIINRMESVGGELNAYTTKEETVVYSIFPAGNTARAIELIGDLANNSRFPDRELAKERDVVLDEIDSYLDTPAEAVFDLFEEHMFAGNSLSHNILGSEESVRRLDSADCRSFLHNFYRPDNFVAFYTGPLSAVKVCAMLNRYFGTCDNSVSEVRIPAPVSPCGTFDLEEHIGSHQSHTVIGINIGGIFSSGRYAVSLLGNIVGGPGMNSLLNIALREKRGLVYSVEASVSAFTDGGAMEIYFGCDPDDRKRCIDFCLKTFRDIADGRMLTDTALARAKKQYLGQLAVASENRENRIMSAARSVLFRGMTPGEQELRDSILAVTHDQISEIAAKFSDASIMSLVP